MPIILAVEDDPKIIQAIRKALSFEKDCRVAAVNDPAKLFDAVAREKPDLILLDIMLPGYDGRQLIQSLRKEPRTRDLPVIFLTGMGSEADKVLGLNLGADDYVVKPFGAMELAARIRTVLRRKPPQAQKKEDAQEGLEIRQLRMDQSTRQAFFKKRRLDLQPKEFDLLFLLASHPGRVFSRSQLLEGARFSPAETFQRAVDSHVKNIRRKLGSGAHLIETVSKMGYRFAEPNE